MKGARNAGFHCLPREGSDRQGAGIRWPGRQQGAAVLMALFVAALATMIITGLFYRQFVLLRTIRTTFTSQSRSLPARRWGRAIRREDATRSHTTRSATVVEPLPKRARSLDNRLLASVALLQFDGKPRPLQPAQSG